MISYLEDFLFEPARARTPIKALSGGERNRLLLARLFTKPCNVLVLDEPTNDLDAETLELLEDLLVEFGGTLLGASLIVSMPKLKTHHWAGVTLSLKNMFGRLHQDESWVIVASTVEFATVDPRSTS